MFVLIPPLLAFGFVILINVSIQLYLLKHMPNPAKSGVCFARVLQALSLFLLFSCSRHELNKCTPAWISFMEGQLFMTYDLFSVELDASL